VIHRSKIFDSLLARHHPFIPTGTQLVNVYILRLTPSRCLSSHRLRVSRPRELDIRLRWAGRRPPLQNRGARGAAGRSGGGGLETLIVEACCEVVSLIREAAKDSKIMTECNGDGEANIGLNPSCCHVWPFQRS